MSEHVTPGMMNDYVDDALDAATRTRVELHLRGCADCASEVHSIGALTTDLRGLGGIRPGRDLLPGIAARIDAAPAVTGAAPRREMRSWPSMPAGWLRAAAVVLVLVGAASLGRMLGDDGRPGFPASPPTLAGTEAEYERAAAELEMLLRTRRDILPRETSDAVDRAIAAVDVALDEARAALVADPGNPELTRMVVAGYEKKLDVLRTAAGFSLL